MNTLDLNIAGYRIRLETTGSSPGISPGKRFEKFISNNQLPYDIKIIINKEQALLPDNATCIFDAPYVEEKDGVMRLVNPQFWSVWKSDISHHILTVYPTSSGIRRSVLDFSFEETIWNLSVETTSESIDPLEYPLDGLVIYYLTVIKGDILIHASGISAGGKGYIFSGISGKGKTTMAELWRQNGTDVIHDDRLVIKNTGDSFLFKNTPVYDNEIPKESLLNKLFLIEHGKENRSERLTGAHAISSVISNCIQHNWGERTIATLLTSVTILCSTVPVYRLYFRPDMSVIEYLTNFPEEL
ncbi:MAG TPA: hypothetical protein VHO50_06250 [Bacteroidales bacterium]|nr:hypothetical protein [Bacteroidales bacterium]